MIGIYLKDTVEISRRNIDEYGAETETTILNVLAYVEQKNIIVIDADGKQVKGSAIVIFESGIDIKYNDRIRILKLNGTDTELKNKKFEILSIEKANGFTDSHIEVMI